MKKIIIFSVLTFVLFVSQSQQVSGKNATGSVKTNKISNIQKIKDTRKQKIVANLDRSYVNINTRWTTHFINVLSRLTKILDKVKLREEEQKNSEALISINAIYSQIDKVKMAVEEQALKTYTIEITSEDKLGEAAKAVHSQLRNDLFSLREQIKAIREAIRKVIQTL